MEVGVLFADLRGFTAWSEERPPAEVAESLNRFYALASRVLTEDDAFVDLIGDQIMALYPTEFPSLGARTPEVMLAAAVRLLGEVEKYERGDTLPLGVGIHMGVASVGNVGDGEIKNFTAVGDVVNTAARLQGCARGGQLVVSDTLYEQAAHGWPAAEPASFSVKGKSAPISAHVIQVGRAAASAAPTAG